MRKPLLTLLARYGGEVAATAAFVVLLVAVALVAPGFFAPGNLRDLLLVNAPVLLVATGMTVVILTRQIDISVGAQFAIVGVVAGLAAKTGLSMWLVLPLAMLLGALLGALNGLLVARLRLPAIVVTLALMVALRDGLRWATEGNWVQDLPPAFQWLGLGQTGGQAVLALLAASVAAGAAWMLSSLHIGRAFYAVGSDAEAARLAGVSPITVTFLAFTLLGALTGLAALLNSVRFSEIQSNAGVGLELKAIAAVVVGGASINGGRGTMAGTVIGVALLGSIGAALTFLGVNPFWERAVQGTIILAAVSTQLAFTRTPKVAV